MKRFLAIFLTALTAAAVTLEWDASPDHAWVTRYWLMVATNSFYGTNDLGTIRAVDVGTNLTCSLFAFQPSNTYYFMALAEGTNGVKSLPSNETNIVVVGYPRSPGPVVMTDTGQWRTVVIQYAADLTGSGFVDVGLFRLRIP